MIALWPAEAAGNQFDLIILSRSFTHTGQVNLKNSGVLGATN
jgi:hypothetical protein